MQLRRDRPDPGPRSEDGEVAPLRGEATSGEARDLEQLLDLEPAARNQFEELKALFDELGSVPKPFPPEGLVAAVMARVPRRPAAQDPSDQLFDQPGVISQSSTKARDRSPGPTAHRVSPQGTYFREQSMS